VPRPGPAVVAGWRSSVYRKDLPFGGSLPWPILPVPAVLLALCRVVVHFATRLSSIHPYRAVRCAIARAFFPFSLIADAIRVRLAAQSHGINLFSVRRMAIRIVDYHGIRIIPVNLTRAPMFFDPMTWKDPGWRVVFCGRIGVRLSRVPGTPYLREFRGHHTYESSGDTIPNLARNRNLLHNLTPHPALARRCTEGGRGHPLSGTPDMWLAPFVAASAIRHLPFLLPHSAFSKGLAVSRTGGREYSPSLGLGASGLRRE